MKKLILFLSILALALTARAQATGLPTPTTHEASLSWTNACPSGVTCTFNVYVCYGVATGCTTSTGTWNLANSTPLSTTSYVYTNVGVGDTYNFLVYALANGDTSSPSNEVSGTIPQGPVAPVASITAQ